MRVEEVTWGELAAGSSQEVGGGGGSCKNFGQQTIHPNSGPVGAGRGGRGKRRERGAGRMGRMDVGRGQGVRIGKIVIWNVGRT